MWPTIYTTNNDYHEESPVDEPPWVAPAAETQKQ